MDFKSIRAVSALKLSLLSIVFTFLTFSALSQSWQEKMQDPNVKINEVQQSFKSAWNNRPIEKGKGYKQFKRWEWFMEQRCFPTGDRFAPDAVYRAMQEQPEMFQSNSNMPGNWVYIGNTSVPTGGGGAGRINSVRNEPGSTTTFYACAPGGGLWKTTNSGVSWSVLNTDFLSSIGVSDVAIDPNDLNTMYLATGDGDAGDTYSLGVLKSTDGGLTWNTTGLSWGVSQTRRTSRILINPDNTQTLVVATSNGIHRTTDGGANWTQVRTGNFKDLIMHPTNPNILYACSSAFFRSTDGGITWTQITSGLPSSGVTRMAVAVSEDSPNYVYILAGASADNGFYGLYRSTDAGANFSTRYTGPINLMGWDPSGMDSGGQAWYDLCIVADPNDAEVIYTGGVNVWKSSNGGTNWSLSGHWYGGGGAPYVHADIHALYFVPGTTRLLVGCDGGVFTSTNGTSYSDISSNLQVGQQYRLSVSDQNVNLVLTGWQDNGTNLKNGGTHTRPIGGDGMECIIDPTNQSIMYGELYYGDIRKSVNTGANFNISVCSSGGTGVDEDGAWVTPYVVGSTAGHLYVGKTRVYRSTDGGTSFTTLGAMGSGVINSLAVAASDNNYIYASKNNVLYVSTDGTNFSSVSGLPGNYITYIAVNPNDEQDVYVTFSGFSSGTKVYRSTDAGGTWTNISGTLPNIPANCITLQGDSNNGMYVGTDAGVYYKDDVLGVWVPYMNDLPNVVVTELEIQYLTSTIVAATYGRGLWSAPLYSPLQLDAAIIEVTAPTGTNCSPDVAGVFQVLNSGEDDITNLSIQYQVDANAPLTYNWTGLLATGESEVITLPTVNYGIGNFTYSVEIISVNFVDDELAANNTGSITYSVVDGTNTVTFHVETDCYGSESSWELTDDLGVVLYSGDGLNSLTAYNTTLCLPDGCFTMTFYDSFGDGMSYPQGCATNGDFYMIDESDGSTIFSMSTPAFGFSEEHTFCFNQNLPGCTDLTACNYDSAAETDDGSCVYGPVNDACSGAIEIIANAAPEVYSNLNTCEDGTNPSCGGLDQIKDVWFSFVYEGGDIILETSFGIPEGGSSMDDTRMAVYDGCNGAQLACSDDNDAGLFSTIEFFCGDLIEGNTYLVQVGGFMSEVGGFSIEYLVFDILGCTNPLADNYDVCANVDDGTCIISGCTNPLADNYNALANNDNGTCIISGCTNPLADNYNALANNDNGTCIISGCTNPLADNYNASANNDNGTCIISGCTNPLADNYDALANNDNGTCIISGCTNPIADNYNALANNDNGTCIISGCTNPLADNYNALANNDNGTCIISGCTNPLADNYNALANNDNGTCIISGCTDSNACNYNANANQNDGSCTFAMTYYLDADGDGFGTTSTTLTLCSPQAGYVANGLDCNDGNDLIYPGTSEICGDGVDNNCNNLIDEGCSGNAPVNDNITNASELNSVPVDGCSFTFGDLTEASPSAESQTICITGEDLWYHFTAQSAGARITVNSSMCNVLVELQDDAGNMMDQENVQSVIGTEILNYGGLTPGQEYYVGVRNYNSAQGTGQFGICISHYQESGCNFSQSNYSLCNLFKAIYAGTSSYEFIFSPVGGGEVISYLSPTSTKISLDWVDGLAYNTSYEVQINPIFNATNGLGQIEPLEVQSSESCIMNIGPPPTVAVRNSDACPNTKGLNQFIMCNPRICGTQGYEWEVTRVDIPGEPTYTVVNGSSRFLQVSTANGFAFGGVFDVRVRPLVQSEIPIEFGPAVCVQINGQSAGLFANESSDNSQIQMNLYPNPAGAVLNISLNQELSSNSRIDILDATGRSLEALTVSEGTAFLQFEIPSHLSNGLYFVRVSEINGTVNLIKPFVVEK